MKRLVVLGIVAMLFANSVSGQDWNESAKKVSTPEALQTEIEGLRPAKTAWREIQWKTCMLDALKESREKKKPVLLWMVGPGEALDGRC